MPLTSKDIVPITTARAKLTELADEVARRGEPKLITKNGESYVALITAEQLDEYQRFKEAEHLSILRATAQALEDVNAGRTMSWEEFQPRLLAMRQRLREQMKSEPLAIHESSPEYLAGPVDRPGAKKVPAESTRRHPPVKRKPA